MFQKIFHKEIILEENFLFVLELYTHAHSSQLLTELLNGDFRNTEPPADFARFHRREIARHHISFP
jgi:hypothetical protein